MLLEKFNLIQKKEFEINISKEAFVDFLESNIGEKEELKIFSKPKSKYYGYCNYTSFEIKENKKVLGKTGDAKIKGEIVYLDNGIKIKAQSFQTSPGGNLIIIAGFAMLLIGFYNIVIYKTVFDEEVFVPLLIGIGFLIIMYLNMKREPIIAMNNFEMRIKNIKKRHHNKGVRCTTPN